MRAYAEREFAGTSRSGQVATVMPTDGAVSAIIAAVTAINSPRDILSPGSGALAANW